MEIDRVDDMRFMPKRPRAEEEGEQIPAQKKERRDAFGRDLRDVLDDDNREQGDRRERRNRYYEEEDEDYDPYTSETRMPFRQFLELNKSSGKSDDDVYKLYLEYKSDHEYRICREFFDEHKDDEWMLEMYHPEYKQPILDAVNTIKRESYTHFEKNLLSHAFDSVCYDQTISATPASLDAQLELASKVAGTLTHIDNIPIRTLPPHHALFIRSIPKSIKRATLLEMYSTLKGYIAFITTPPNPLKKYTRMGYIYFSTAEEMQEALLLLNTYPPVNDYTLDYKVNTPQTQEDRLLPFEFTFPERITHDLSQIIQLVNTLDTESHLQNTTHTLIDLLDSDKRRLDMYVLYLRYVHSFEYYIGQEVRGIMRDVVYVRRATPQTQPANHTYRNGEEPGQKALKRLDLKIQTRIHKPEQGESIISLGGKCLKESLDGYVAQIVRKEGEGKYRCRECEKLFKGEAFCTKHVYGKHEDIIGGVKTDLEYFNAYVRDFDRVGEHGVGSGRNDLRSAGQRGGRSGYGGRGRDSRDFRGRDVYAHRQQPTDPRGMRSYVDLDNVTSEPAQPVSYDY